MGELGGVIFWPTLRAPRLIEGVRMTPTPALSPNAHYSITELLEHREAAADPASIERIDRAIEYRRLRNRIRQASKRQEYRDRTAEEVAAVLVAAFPTGTQVCKTCQRELPLTAFAPRPKSRIPLWNRCLGCKTEPHLARHTEGVSA